jgi:hypothetical protein
LYSGCKNILATATPGAEEIHGTLKLSENTRKIIYLQILELITTTNHF